MLLVSNTLLKFTLELRTLIAYVVKKLRENVYENVFILYLYCSLVSKYVL